MSEVTTGAKILVVDDTKANLLFLEKILTDQGYQVDSAPDGVSAISSAQTNQPDLILLDVAMPDMSGHQVCENLKTDPRTRHIPVLFMSASDEILDKVRAFFVGGVDYLLKPFQAEEVLARVENHLTLRTLQKNLEQQNYHLQQEVTQRKQIELSLKQSEERYRRLVELSPDAIVVHQRGRILYGNAATVTLLAANTLDDVLGKTILDIVHREYHAIMKKRLRKLFKEKTPTDLLEARFIRLDGEMIDVEIAESLIAYQGKPAVQLVIRDITERRRTEDFLRRLKKAVETTEVGVTITDQDGRIVYINPADADMHGYTVEELMNQRSHIYTTPELREDSIRTNHETGELERWKRERINVRSDGTKFPVMLISNPIYDENSTFVGRVTVCEDMSERKRTENLLQETDGKLQESEKRYYKMFKNATVGIFQATSGGKLLLANSAMARILGYASASQLAKRVKNLAKDVFLDPQQWKDMTEKVKTTGDPVKFETLCRVKDGGERYALFNLWPVLDGQKHVRYLEGFMEDMTEQKQTERLLHKQEVLLRGVARAMNHLLVGTSVKASIVDALEILGFVAEVDRINIFENEGLVETGEPAMSQRFTWAKEWDSVRLNIPELQQLPYQNGYQRWYETLSANKPLWGVVRDFPESERQLLEARGIRSLLLVPITIRNEFWGFIGFDACENERHWNEEEKSILLAMAGSIGGAIALQEAKTRLVAANDELAVALEDLKNMQKGA